MARPAAVTHEANGFVTPFVIEEIQGVLQCRVETVVVLRHDDDNSVRPRDRRGPLFRVVKLVVARNWLAGLVIEWKVDLGEIDQFDIKCVMSE